MKRATRILPPGTDDVLTYLGRIDFFHSIHSDVAVHSDISKLAWHRRNPSHTFTVILAPSPDDFDLVADVVWRHLQQQSKDVARYSFAAFEELLTNIADHSNPISDVPAMSFVQVQMYAENVDLAFGDLGRGYLRTLRQNPELNTLENEREALAGVLLEGYSRLGHQEEDRGGGLRRIRQLVQRLDGRMKLLSTNGLAVTLSRTSSEPPPPPPVSTLLLPDAFPGTMAWIQLPRRCVSRQS
jgi:hypothetical protein